MRNPTHVTTLILAVAGGLASLFILFPGQAGTITGSVRRMIDPNRAELVRLEYVAANPQRSLGWRTLQVVQTPEECLPLLARDHAGDPQIAGPIGALRCVAYRKNDEMIGILRTRQIAAPEG